jgi:hypothetical protein
VNEQGLIWFLVVTAGVLLFWRLALATGFLPLAATLRLYRESASVLRRNGWILLVYLLGFFAGLLVTETLQILATRAYRRQIPQPMNNLWEGMPIPWDGVLSSAARRSLVATSTSVWTEPCRGMGLWLPAVILLSYRRRLVPQVLPDDGFAPDTVRYLRRLLGLSATAMCILPVSQLASAVFYDSFRTSSVWPLVLAMGVLTVPGTIFGIAASTYIACGLIASISTANAVGTSQPQSLLAVRAEDFWRLLKFVVLATLILGGLPLLARQCVQLAPLVLQIPTPKWVLTVTKFLYGAAQVLGIGVFPAMLFIVLDKAEWKTALQQTWDFWRNHAGEWLAFVLPVYALAFAANVLSQLVPFYTGPTSSTRHVATILTQLVGVIASAWWLVTVVRWWNLTKTRAGP